MLRKLFITPYFGDLPEWIDKYEANMKSLEKYGYDWLLVTDLDDFLSRIWMILGEEPQIIPGTSRSHNFRTAFGLLFAKELEGYDFWGITDLDCVYGKVDNFLADEELGTLDIWSNHHNYICGPWTLFRNNELVNNLFREVPNWHELMFDQHSHAGRWTEVEYSEMVDALADQGRVRREYTHYQGQDPNDTSKLTYKNGMLFDGDDEIMMFHFNRTKIWPL